jgi:hypothetical protein
MMQMMNRQMVNRRGALCALALSFGLGMVTSGLGQSLTWLGTYDGYAEATVSLLMAPSWSVGQELPQPISPSAGHPTRDGRTSARLQGRTPKHGACPRTVRLQLVAQALLEGS